MQIHKSFCADVDACVFVNHGALSSIAIEVHHLNNDLLDARERNAERIFMSHNNNIFFFYFIF